MRRSTKVMIWLVLLVNLIFLLAAIAISTPFPGEKTSSVEADVVLPIQMSFDTGLELHHIKGWDELPTTTGIAGVAQTFHERIVCTVCVDLRLAEEYFER
jgi:hypothetical protein